MKEAWKSFRYRLEYIGCLLLARVVPLIPRKGCVWLASLLAGIAWRLDGRNRHVALANIEAALGVESPAEQERIARASYRDFARTMVDLFWSPRLTRETYARYIRIEGAGVLQTLREKKQGAVLMCVHNGGFEWASIGIGFLGEPTSIVAEAFKNPLLGPVFNQLREVSGHRIIPQESSMVRLLKTVKRAGFAGMLIDLTLRPDQSATPIKAFGRWMCVTCLHAVLASRGGAALVPVESEAHPDGSCRVLIHPPLEIPDGKGLGEITQITWDAFEILIRRRPESWMWAYKHWRFRPKGTAMPYPYYAKESSRFEKLLRRAESEKHLTNSPE